MYESGIDGSRIISNIRFLSQTFEALIIRKVAFELNLARAQVSMTRTDGPTSF